MLLRSGSGSGACASGLLPGQFGLDPLQIGARTEILIPSALIRRSRYHAVDEPIPFDLHGVKDLPLRVLFEDELDPAIKGGEPLEVGVGLGRELERLSQVMLHCVALAPCAEI